MTALERMAVAMAATSMRRTGWPDTFIVGIEKDARSVAVAVQTYGDMARAALAAIREPSDGMMTPFAYLESWQMPDTKRRWTAMVDHILSGGE